MKQVIWSQTYAISSFLVNPQKKLGLFGLLGLLQDVAWNHATHLGHGYENMVKENIGWVLTRQKLSMESWPGWGENLEIRTWVRPIKGIVAIRDFEIIFNGKKIGDCSTQWLILDLKTRRASEKILNLEDEFRFDAPVFIDASKIILRPNLKLLTGFSVRNSDLDLNGHVNNTRYAHWVLDAISQDKHHECTLSGYEVNFIAESKAGDEVLIFSGPLSGDEIQFQGVRNSDKKVIFASTLKITAEQLAPDCNPS